MGRRTKERGRVQDAFRDYPELDEDNIVRATIDPKEARRMFEQGTLHQNDLNSAGRASQELRPTSPNRLDDTRQRYLEQTTAPAPVPVAGKDRKSLKKRKKFGRKKKVSSSPSSSGSNSDADSDEISWDDLIDSRYTPLIIDLADWLGYITGKKQSQRQNVQGNISQIRHNNIKLLQSTDSDLNYCLLSLNNSLKDPLFNSNTQDRYGMRSHLVH